MADDPSTIAWRLQRLEEAVRDLGLRVVSVELYTRDRAEVERDLVELRAAIADEKQARKDDVKDIRAQADKQAERQSGNWRQALFGGVIPGLVVLLSVAVQIVLATRGGK
ncbi:hypothetical protein [Actinomadura sp. 21ATH]|uniref:hypothetical protein n=1 Tax=Actinomadura sp. 21ATH TaxID=1735444 RepID=UPI0035C0DE2C